MNSGKIPQSDSIRELAQFWDKHDLTDFEDELEQVSDPVFERQTEVRIHLPLQDAEAIDNLARSQGVDPAAMIRGWVLERVQAT